MKNTIWTVPALLTSVLLAGCASVGGNAADETVSASVLNVFPADASRARLPPCLAALTPADYAARRFVKVRYRRFRVARTEVAELAPGVLVKAGDRLEVWPASCASGAISRSGRLLSSAQQQVSE